MVGITVHRVTVESEQRLLARIRPNLFENDLDPIQVVHYLKQPNHFLFVAVEWGVVVGLLTGVVHHHPDGPPDFLITSINVDDRSERKGVGQMLLEHASA